MRIHVAIAPFCSACPSVVTLGVRAGMADYSAEERRLIQTADKVFFPTMRFMDIFEAVSKPTFPSPQCHRYRRSRVIQTLLFQELQWPPHPRTRLYFGNRQKQAILKDFRMPFWAMGPLIHPAQVHRIESPTDLAAVAEGLNPLVIQELIPWEDRIRLVSVQFECLAAQRIIEEPQCENHVQPVDLRHPALTDLLEMNSNLTQWMRLDDIAVDWGYHGKRWYLIQMGRPPLHIPTGDHSISRHSHIGELIERGVL